MIVRAFGGGKFFPGVGRLKLEEEVARWAEPLLAGMGYELVDVEYVREGREWFLRFFIDRPGGVDLDACEAASRALERELDLRDPIPHSYRLEVSSPGLERPLKKDADYRRYAGSLVCITTFAPVDGRKSFTGRLQGLEGEQVLVQVGNDVVAIPRGQVASARLAVEI